MAETKPVDTKPDKTDANQTLPASNPTKPDDLTEIHQKLKGLDEEVKTLKHKNTELATENATIKATYNDMQIQRNLTDDDIPIDMPEEEAVKIGELMKDDPTKGTKALLDYNNKTLRATMNQQRQKREKDDKVRQEVNTFVEKIYQEKPYLRQFDSELGAIVTVKRQATGKVFESILETVKEYEAKHPEIMPVNNPPEVKPDNKIPAGAKGEGGSSQLPANPEPAKEEEEETVAQTIARREKEMRMKVARSPRQSE